MRINIKFSNIFIAACT